MGLIQQDIAPFDLYLDFTLDSANQVLKILVSMDGKDGKGLKEAHGDATKTKKTGNLSF